MSILIAFFGGMLTLLSPCTLPVIPLLFASVRGRRGQLAIMLAGMALMFGAVSWLVTVASGWVVNLTLAGRGLALAFFALVGLSLLSPHVAQRLTSPLVALGNQLNDASSRQRGWIGSLLAGLVVIGVHTPEYPWERSLPLLREAVKDWRITYPVVADNEYAIWNAFGNQYWPAHYIFDARGQLRYTAFGEGDYARQEQVIQQLLQESKA